MEWMQHGLDLPKKPFEDGVFWQTLADVNNAALSKQERRQRIIDALYSYLSLSSGTRTPEQTEQMYARFYNCIRRATSNLHEYFKDLLVQDVYQRVMPSSFVRHTADPEFLVDCMATQGGKNERLRFEARRALYFGAHFFEYETELGTFEQLETELSGVDRFFEALFSFGRNRNTRIYHKIKTIGGYLGGYAVRVPLFDRTDDKRRDFENYFPVTFCPLSIQGASANGMQTHCMYDSRVKTEFSAALKAMRKGVPIRALKDCLASTLYLYPGYEDAFDDVVETLTSALPIQTDDRLIHQARRISPSIGTQRADNVISSTHFKMEKMIAFWNPATMFSADSKERAAVERVLPFSLQRNREAFFEEQRTFRPMQVEIQIGLLEDFINNHLVGSDENRLFYEVRRATEKTRDDAVPILDALLPREFYGIRFNDPVIIQALAQKQRSQLGIHQQALERLSRG